MIQGDILEYAKYLYDIAELDKFRNDGMLKVLRDMIYLGGKVDEDYLYFIVKSYNKKNKEKAMDFKTFNRNKKLDIILSLDSVDE